MCANFVGDKCVFQHSMTDSVQKCRTNSPLCTFFQHRPFLLGLLLFLACWWRRWCCCCCSCCCWWWWWWWSCSRDKITEAVWVTTTLFYTSIIATSHTSREETDTRTNMRAQRHYGKHTNAKLDNFLEMESQYRSHILTWFRSSFLGLFNCHRQHIFSESHPSLMTMLKRDKKSFIFACEGPNELYLSIDISKHLQFMMKSKNN